MKKMVLKSLGFRKLSHSSEMQNDALMHREGLKGTNILDKIRKIPGYLFLNSHWES